MIEELEGKLSHERQLIKALQKDVYHLQEELAAWKEEFSPRIDNQWARDQAIEHEQNSKTDWWMHNVDQNLVANVPKATSPQLASYCADEALAVVSNPTKTIQTITRRPNSDPVHVVSSAEPSSADSGYNTLV
jgi:hypothetical protein